ncbi:hypothetical protein GCM10017083_23140 [Thalassobaculum fulvum]|uniref:Uncharacterized protein n=1 Tax=Thalassobaculum fulvum TaxID=1633335 RepID=A0A919CPP6_9PROT|nr:hypothetical protein [Thalassobaculum fulvum]GHD50009.1 hypothetical protein GCM10017083_23140 [Thalassobaculum fulvum]
MTVRVELGGFEAVSARRRSRALAELASLAAAVAAERLEVVASGEAAFAARLLVDPATPVAARPAGPQPSVVWRAFGEACPAPPEGRSVLVEAGGLGRLLDAQEGPVGLDAAVERRLQALAGSARVTWRVAAGWQVDLLAERFGIPGRRIQHLPVQVSLPPRARLREALLPQGLPADYVLCLTPLGADGDVGAVVRAHGLLGAAAPPLVVLGVEDEAWRPGLAEVVAEAGSRGRVLLLRDLDPGTEAAAIARAGAVVAVDRHPAHAVRLRQAAMLGRPAALRRHPAHRAWVDGGSWFDDDVGELAEALRDPVAIRLREPCGDGRGPADLSSWLRLAGQRDEPRETAQWVR